MTTTSSTALYDIPVAKIDGAAATLREHAGEVLLIVNVASKCGLTPQYAGLEALQERYGKRKFSVLGFPAYDFGAQEPGTNAEIREFCTTKFGVQFPLYAKIGVTGAHKHPLYRFLIEQQPDTEDRQRMETSLRNYKMEPNPRPEVLWNFEKFLVGRKGNVVRRFAPDTVPDAAQLIAAIEAELAETV
jgi:glutathione peroxidase